MNGKLRRMLQFVLHNIGRPRFDMGDDTKIHEADHTIDELKKYNAEMERRLQLRGIQASPRGTING